MPAAPFFTVIMPLYNHAAYVEEAIASVQAQSFEDFELVVCNDGSTDASLALVDGFRDARIRVIDKPNGGTVSALNACLMNASGRFVCWLSSDDLFTPEKLRLHYVHHRAHPASLLSAAPFGYLKDGQTVADVQLKPAPEARLMQFVEGNYVNGLSVCASRELYSLHGLFDSRYRFAHDVERWFRFLAHHEVAFLPGTPHSYSRLQTSIVADADVLGEIDVLKVVFQQLDAGGVRALLPQTWRQAPLTLNLLLMLCMRLFSPSNLFFRFDLGRYVVGKVAETIRTEGLQAQLANLADLVAAKPADERSRFLVERLREVHAALETPGEPGPSFPEHLVRLHGGATGDVKRILGRYLRIGL